MEEKLVPLTACAGTFQVNLIESVLQEARIPHAIRDGAMEYLTIYMGPQAPLGSKVFLVPEDRLQEAKDVLCANGVVCEVSERLLARALDEIVKPLLSAPGDRDLSRLARFLEVNNKETVKALLEETLRVEGGRDLLEDAFFRLDQDEDLGGMRTLARVLGRQADPRFYEKLRKVVESGALPQQLGILEVIRDFPETSDRAEVLALALRSPDLEVREAAEEALFSLGKGDFGYEADGEPEKREAAVQRFIYRQG